jgi:peptidoglycan hydrolase CwlO-like protein
MPTINYLKSVFKKLDEQVKALEGGLRHITSQQQKLEKKKMQFEHLLKIRKEELKKLVEQIEEIQKIQLKEAGTSRWQTLFPR